MIPIPMSQMPCLNTNNETIPLKIIQWNICSVRNKIDHLKLLINKYNPDLILLNETWLQPVHSFRIKGFTILRSYRNDGYGGIATLIKNEIYFQKIQINTNYHPAHFQFLAIKIQNLTLVNVYRPPNANISLKFWLR